MGDWLEAQMKKLNIAVERRDLGTEKVKTESGELEVRAAVAPRLACSVPSRCADPPHPLSCHVPPPPPFPML